MALNDARDVDSILSATCTADYGPYPEEGSLTERLRWWVPKSARFGQTTLESDIMDAYDALAVHPSPGASPTVDAPVWIVNDSAELGVKIGDRFFFLYKGDNLEYKTGLHDDDTPMMWRPVGKREFGECCHPVKFWKEGAPPLPKRYADELQFIPGLSFGRPEDADWRPLPAFQLPQTDTGDAR